MPAFHFDNTYARELPGFYTAWQPARVPAPQLLFFNAPLAAELGLDLAALQGPAGAEVFAGNTVPAGAEPLAQVYAGHQFGGFSPRLGDGRALLLGEVVDTRGQRRDIAMKGSGRTPYSRGGDGKAAVGPMLREVLIGEAMHALGIPTTRALAVAGTGERVLRERPWPGAVLTRVAASHLRVGTFQYFLAEGELPKLRQLLDYAIARHDPALAGTPGHETRQDTSRETSREMAFLRAVAQRQARLIAQWMNVGFIHGVMNTDNMTISGETIDYGPCAFMEAYDPATVFSSIDHGGRYAYGNQPGIARWNLARLAETLLPLLADESDEAAVQRVVAEATAVIDAFPGWYAQALLQGQRAKLGLLATADDAEDGRLVDAWLALLHTQAVDFTLAWRLLADAAEGRPEPLFALFGDHSRDRAALDAWLQRWQARLAQDDAASPRPPAERGAAMRLVNPWIIPRNHQVEAALAAANGGDMAPFHALLAALQRPFDSDATLAPYAVPAPAAETAAYQTFCGT